jgi:hypothetical protein
LTEGKREGEGERGKKRGREGERGERGFREKKTNR